MQQINVNELKPHPRNNEFFDDMTGEKWKEFLDSIKSRGIIEPIVITPDKMIVSGHQRVRACKELGIQSVMCDIHTYDNDDQIIQDLLETNIRQRGDVGGSAKKVGLRIRELERIYGIDKGNNQRTSNNFKSSKTQQQLATQMGISVDTLQNYKLLSAIIPELNTLVETGVVTKTTALAIMKNLSSDEQEQLISSLDTTKKITQREAQKYIDEIKQLRPDNLEIKQLKNMISELQTEKNILERKAKLNQEDSVCFNKLKSNIKFLTKQKSNLGRKINSATELSELTVKLQQLLEKELAPIKFKRCIEVLDSSDICVENLLNIISQIDEWSNETKKLLINKYKQNDILNSVKKDTEDITKDIKILKKTTDVICSRFHSKRKRDLKCICKARVWFLFNNDKTCEYVLFNSFLFKRIYTDIATHFNLDTWLDLSMENYELENSIYSQAKEFATYWTPSNSYIKECIEDMIAKRDEGLLSPEKCRALTEYLKFTNNGEINPFSS